MLGGRNDFSLDSGSMDMVGGVVIGRDEAWVGDVGKSSLVR